jgi:hypothetical protein
MFASTFFLYENFPSLRRCYETHSQPFLTEKTTVSPTLISTSTLFYTLDSQNPSINLKVEVILITRSFFLWQQKRQRSSKRKTRCRLMVNYQLNNS